MASGNQQPPKGERQMLAREREHGELPSPDLSLFDRKVRRGLFVFIFDPSSSSLFVVVLVVVRRPRFSNAVLKDLQNRRMTRRSRTNLKWLSNRYQDEPPCRSSRPISHLLDQISGNPAIGGFWPVGHNKWPGDCGSSCHHVTLNPIFKLAKHRRDNWCARCALLSPE